MSLSVFFSYTDHQPQQSINCTSLATIPQPPPSIFAISNVSFLSSRRLNRPDSDIAPRSQNKHAIHDQSHRALQRPRIHHSCRRRLLCLPRRQRSPNWLHPIQHWQRRLFRGRSRKPTVLLSSWIRGDGQWPLLPLRLSAGCLSRRWRCLSAVPGRGSSRPCLPARCRSKWRGILPMGDQLVPGVGSKNVATMLQNA